MQDTAFLSRYKKEIIVEKDEITKMPQGMSSEELDALTTDEEESPEVIVQEVATEEKTPPAEESVETEAETAAKVAIEEKPAVVEKEEVVEEQKVDPKDAVIGAKRRENRDLALENARMRGELDARKSIQVESKEKPKSPLELAEADYLTQNGSMEGFAMNGKLYRQQKAFDDEQAASKAATDQQSRSKVGLEGAAEELQEGDLSTEKKGQGLDYQSVSNIGDKYLTRGDLVDLGDIQAKRGNAAALKESYKIMVRRVLAANNEDSKLLQNAMNGKSQTKPKTEKPDIDAITTEGDDEVKGEAEKGTQDNRLYEFVTSP